jgi:hypothetical protein
MENLSLESRLFTNKVIDKRQLKGLVSDIFNNLSLKLDKLV